MGSLTGWPSLISCPQLFITVASYLDGHFLLVCSFWKYVSDLERRETKRYLQMFYILMMRPLIAKVQCEPYNVIGSLACPSQSARPILGVRTTVPDNSDRRTWSTYGYMA